MMKVVVRGCLAVGLLATGYMLGASGTLSPIILQAQDAAQGPSDEAMDKIREAGNAVNAAMVSLQNENLYKSALGGANTFAVMAGGVDAIADLEAGRGVDPVTFAGLYAGRAIDEVAEHLSKDDEGRLTYKNKLVRMYPISRLKQVYSQRARIAGEEEQEN